MFNDRGPHYSAKCPFYIKPNNPLSAETSIKHCVRCATCGHQHLQGMRDDFRQIAYLTILEEEPKYDPQHESGASFITFMKSRVCGGLWSQRRKELKYTPYVSDPPFEPDAPPNPLVAVLTAEACASKSLEDEVCEKIEVERTQVFFAADAQEAFPKRAARHRVEVFQRLLESRHRQAAPGLRRACESVAEKRARKTPQSAFEKRR